MKSIIGLIECVIYRVFYAAVTIGKVLLILGKLCFFDGDLFGA